jgi:asparagine synthase (glutamine-hydrolysing)
MAWGPLERAQYLEITTFLSSYLLSSQGDRMGMANSVEGRFPFLDHRVVEFCCRLPSRMKLRVLRDKHVLREVARPLVPAEILRRAKRPYRAPIQKSFLNRSCRDYVLDLVSPPALRAAALFNPDAVRHLMRKAEQADRLGETDSMALVGILSAQLLHSQFVGTLRRAAPVGPREDCRVVDRRGSMPASAADGGRATLRAGAHPTAESAGGGL